ncbi:hypothetical protein ACFQ46_10730 [Kineococcus sp. GCM10028916]|uniref:hypothetical protein n=1 Tax=Kineococcus sp. GCM10028916 TaxID=3273394 RepID=UPI003644DAF0
MPEHRGTTSPADQQTVLAEVNARIGTHYRWCRRLDGGEQGGAHVVVDRGRSVVLTWEPPGRRSDQLRRAFPVVVRAIAGGWAAARWLTWGELAGGGTFLLQEHVPGTPMTRLDLAAARAVLAANETQSGLAFPDARDDSDHLDAVLVGDHPWKADVAGFTPAGAALVRHGDEVVARVGRASIPRDDLVHGDHSSANVLLDRDRGELTATLVDCQTVGRGSRVRDLADLYRQTFLHPGVDGDGRDLLRAAACGVAGPAVFARCVVAVTYDNLAWWVEHRSAAEFDRACGRLHRLFAGLEGTNPGPASPSGRGR